VLATALAALHAFLGVNRVRLLPVVNAVLVALQNDPLTASPCTGLIVASLPWKDVAESLTGMANRGELHAEALMTAVRAIESLGATRSLYRFNSILTSENTETGSATPLREENSDKEAVTGLEVLEKTLATHLNDSLRRIALAALVAQARGVTGWSPTLRNRLEIYRNDSSALVAAAAQFTLPPLEEVISE